MKKLDRGVIIMLLLLLYTLISSVIMQVIIVISEARLGLMHLIIISQFVSFGVPFFVYLAITRQRLPNVLLLKSLDIKNLMLVIGIVFCAMPFASLLSSITSMFVDNHIASLLLEATVAYPFLLSLFAIGIMPSIFEELMFRGVIYKEYTHLPIKHAALINGLFFGLIHMSFQQFFYAFALGALFSYLLYYTRSFLAPVIGHFIVNGFNITMVYGIAFAMEYFEEFYQYDLTYIDEPNPLLAVGIMSVVSLVFAPLFIFLFRELVSHNKHNVEV